MKALILAALALAACSPNAYIDPRDAAAALPARPLNFNYAPMTSGPPVSPMFTPPILR